MADLNLTVHDAGLRFHPTSAEEIIVEAQEILATYLDPEGDQSARKTLDRLLELLDSPEAFEIYDNVMSRRQGGYRENIAQH